MQPKRRGGNCSELMRRTPLTPVDTRFSGYDGGCVFVKESHEVQLFSLGERNTLTLALSRERERGLDSRLRGNDGGGYRAFLQRMNSYHEV